MQAGGDSIAQRRSDARLRERGAPVETLVLPGEAHVFLRHASGLEVHRRSAEFFRRRLAEGGRR